MRVSQFLVGAPLWGALLVGGLLLACGGSSADSVATQNALQAEAHHGCSIADHCAFFGELGQCGGVTACRQLVAGAGCHGSAVASPSDAQFCESAASQLNPQQACQIWGPAFNCVWTEGQTECVAQDGVTGNPNACSLADHCGFLGQLGQCGGISACREETLGAGCHGSAVASPSDAQFCESAVSQLNPQQACQIWGPVFNCLWTEGTTGCVPR